MFDEQAKTSYVFEHDAQGVRIVDEQCRLLDRALVKAWNVP
jgi:hypothetical protein